MLLPRLYGRTCRSTVKVEGGNNEHLFSLGQPLSTDQPSTASVGADLPDVSSLKPAEHLSNGDEYTVTGSVSTASIDDLRAAGTEYPSWVTSRYLDAAARAAEARPLKAQEVTRSTATPYDEAAAIEKYLRTFPNDYDVPARAIRAGQRGLLPVRRAARVLRLSRVGDGGDAAVDRHTGARGDGVRGRSAAAAGRQRHVQADAAPGVRLARGVLPRHRLGGVQPDAEPRR